MAKQNKEGATLIQIDQAYQAVCVIVKPTVNKETWDNMSRRILEAIEQSATSEEIRERL